ncbi:diguanylate cyclase [Sulfuricurvum sp.]|jgi:GGDEF domain-containing protein|uniref:diguanylate cyclase domain-containing protein n=1 Tax=Sulfuricurvum sp. TaxID=2025608 RepID=UPI0025D01840|nr:diguanylate cyclase [Sulfuricurvum sp.]
MAFILFALICPFFSNLKELLSIYIVQRLQVEYSQTNPFLFHCRNNKPLFQNQQISVTLSIGMTNLQPNDTIDTVIERSDAALYKAKNNGKDRLEMEL